MLCISVAQNIFPISMQISSPINFRASKWLLADSRGGFSQGCFDLVNRSHYDALYTCNTTNHLHRHRVVTHADVRLIDGLDNSVIELSTSIYGSDQFMHPDGHRYLTNSYYEIVDGELLRRVIYRTSDNLEVTVTVK